MPTRALVTGALAILLSAAAPVIPATAAPGTPASVLLINANRGTSQAAPIQVTLTCDPAGGTHTAAEEACASLDAADGDLTALQPKDVFCPMVYEPVTVEVAGHWWKTAVAFQRSYPNLCAAYAESGGVFQF